MENPQKIIPEKCIGYKPPPVYNTLDWRDAIIYAIGISHSNNPLNESDLQYTFEMHDEFKVYPTVPFFHQKLGLFETLKKCPGIPDFHPMKLLHGEYLIEVHKPLQIDQEYVTQAELIDVVDKVKGCLIVLEVKSFENIHSKKEGELVITSYFTLFIRGLGGFGFKGMNQEKQGYVERFGRLPKIPASPPTFSILQETNPNLAIIYRLYGDENPLHIDPKMAGIAGFDKPILHGLSSFGICVKLIVQKMGNGDCDRLKMIRGRFTSHVFPGETLIVNGWVEGGYLIFNAVVKERNKVVIVGTGLIEGVGKL